MSKGNRDWVALIREQSISGESQAEFCRGRGISLATFQYHKSNRRKKEPREKDGFIPLIEKEGGERIELEVGRELRLLFPAETSAKLLSEVIRCLSSK